MPSLKQLPKEERPRERLLSQGAETLSLSELLAICLGNGQRGKSVLTLAQDLLASFGTLNRLMEASVEELVELKGIGEIKAIQLKAIFALGKRQEKIVGKAKFAIQGPKDVSTLIKFYLMGKKKERAIVIFRDAKGYAFHHEILAIGTLSEVLIHPREVFYQAIRYRAYSVILAHNHPSGDPTPSIQDQELTKMLIHSGLLVGVPLDDHIIFGEMKYVSLWHQKAFAKRDRY